MSADVLQGLAYPMHLPGSNSGKDADKQDYLSAFLNPVCGTHTVCKQPFNPVCGTHTVCKQPFYIVAG
jgi:hypothetical protein